VRGHVDRHAVQRPVQQRGRKHCTSDQELA
jgi:hypothetical protein